jgi:hypothetical protein
MAVPGEVLVQARVNTPSRRKPEANNPGWQIILLGLHTGTTSQCSPPAGAFFVS